MPGSRCSVVVFALLYLPAFLWAQEGGGQAEIGFQQYYLSIGSQRVANISGLAVNYSQFLPGIGLFSASLSPALNNRQFRTGDDYLRLKGLPWRGQYWTFNAGDFQVPGQLVPVAFTNIYFPQITGRGVSVEATHGGRAFGFFYGTGTIANTPRVVLRLAVPQKFAGLYVRQQIGKRLLLGARVMHFSNDLLALVNSPYLLTQNSHLKTANQLSVSGSYTLAGPLKWYGEAAWSASTQDGGGAAGGRAAPFSTLIGPVLDSRFVTMRANYTFQNASYFPVLGYYLGDRKGPFAEVIVRPLQKVEIYGSASGYENNVARDPSVPSIRTSSESAGMSVQLPGRISVNGQYTLLNLATRQTGDSPWVRARNQQQSVTLSRSFARQNLRLTAREFSLASPISPQRQRSTEIEDILHLKHLMIGGGVRMQRLLTTESRTTIYYRALAQFHIRRFSAFANVETGNDLQNRTLFATNTVSTTIYGASLTVSRNWEFQAEAYRNNLITSLNPQSIFVLQGQGVYIPGALAAINQWSLYFRMTRKLNWGHPGAASETTQYVVQRAALKGSIEGFVMERLAEGNRPADGIVISLDRGRSVATDAEGHFRFSDVNEGPHKIAISAEELLAEYDPGKNQEAHVEVVPNKPVRADLDVIRLSTVRGRVSGPPEAALESVVIRMLAPQRGYTTPDSEGNFTFYNLHEGSYSFALDLKSLPEGAELKTADRVDVPVRPGRDVPLLHFEFEVHKPEKTVRKIFEKKSDDQPVPPAPQAVIVPAVPEDTVKTPPAPAPPAGGSVSAETHQRLGRELIRAGKYREAVLELSEAIRLAPSSALAYNARGYAWLLLRNYRAALEDLTEAIRLNPNYLNAYEIRSRARKDFGDAPGAEADLRRARELAKKNDH